MTTKKRNSNRSQKSSINEVRQKQLEELRVGLSKLKQKYSEVNGRDRKKLSLLESVSKGLYEEIDKLSKKAPADTVTDLALEQINSVIRDTKKLIPDDEYIQKLNEFVAAGDNPQHRDAVIVMKQVTQGLKRFQEYLDPLIVRLENHIEIVEGIEKALDLYMEGQDPVTVRAIRSYDKSVSRVWSKEGIGYNSDGEFDFGRLDRVGVVSLFQILNE